jgi:hypothetical protein
VAGKTLFNTLCHSIIRDDKQNKKHVYMNNGLTKKIAKHEEKEYFEDKCLQIK